MKNCSFKKEITHRTLSKVIRFGSDLFSPLIPPLTTSNTTAVNPQDIILNREAVFPLYLEKTSDFYQSSLTSTPSKVRENEIYSNSAIAIGPAGYIETVRSPYSNFEDIFFDVTTPDSSFSIECKSNDVSNDIIRGHNDLCEPSMANSNTFTMRSNSDEESNLGYALPPSSAILQSQLDNSSLDYFISNNSFIEEIKSSFSIEQQQYINSGMTNLSSTVLCTTTPPSLTTKSDDLITPNYLESVNILQPDVTSYHGMFENCTSEDESDNCYSTMVSPSTDYLDEDSDNNTIKSLSPIVKKDDDHTKGRLQALLCEINRLIDMGDDCSIAHLEDMKKEYISEISDAITYSTSWPPVNDNKDKKESLYFAIINSYNKINENIGHISTKTNRHPNIKKARKNSDFSNPAKREKTTSNKKRKLLDKNIEVDVESRLYKRKAWKRDASKKVNDRHSEDVKKSRKNYNTDTINVLMDWYLENEGKPPTAESKQYLADLTGKTDIQITTWFQNARRRYQKKLENFQALNSKYPTLVYDYQSLKTYMKSNKY